VNHCFAEKNNYLFTELYPIFINSTSADFSGAKYRLFRARFGTMVSKNDSVVVSFYGFVGIVSPAKSDRCRCKAL